MPRVPSALQVLPIRPPSAVAVYRRMTRPVARARLAPWGAAASAALLLLALAVGCAPRSAFAAVKPADSSDQGGQLELQFAANKNRNGAPVGTVTKAEVAGRTLYYEVPQVRQSAWFKRPLAALLLHPVAAVSPGAKVPGTCFVCACAAVPW